MQLKMMMMKEAEDEEYKLRCRWGHKQSGWDLTQHLNDEEEAEEEKKKKKEDEHEDEDEIAAEDDDERSGRRRIQMKMQMGSQAIKVGLNPTPKR